jgi:hypothetical protein
VLIWYNVPLLLLLHSCYVCESTELRISSKWHAVVAGAGLIRS